MSLKSEILKNLWRSWSTRIGIIFLTILISISAFVLISYPADFGLKVWSNPSYWADNPKLAPPTWTTIFSKEKLPHHMIFEIDEPTRFHRELGMKVSEYKIEVNYDYDVHPSFLHILIENITFYSSRPPRLEFFISRPDNLTIRLASLLVRGPTSLEEPPYRRYVESPSRIILTEDQTVILNLINSLNENYGLSLTLEDVYKIGSAKIFFGCPSSHDGREFTILKGRYSIIVKAFFYDEVSRVEKVSFILGGRVYGLLGTDIIGRDILIGLLFGFPVSLMIGLMASILVTSIGAALGIVSGYVGGRTDTTIQRTSDIIMNMPLLPVLIFFTFILREFGFRLFLIILILTAFSWPGLTIVIRPMVMQMKSSQFIEAAISCGASRRWIMVKHVLPNLTPFIIAQSIFLVPSAILAEAALSFLGLGDPTIPTWGQMLDYGFRSGAIYLGYWWWVIPPGLLIVFSTITFLLITIGLEPMLNPRLKTVI
ncbi:MAG: ABC transporter permease [Aigarchaeota archaeon]|nr:ABC transporter permease [Aigarchaeota archaeon]MCX8193270.1 ABC transporter permease [Nitrososphaeria archaeon]MDW7987048.1 ABC transporter permease [Nitrososphaerota archaeon]